MGANFKWESLHQLAGKWHLAVRCACGHRAVLDSEKLFRYYLCHQWSCARHRISEHLYCTRCRRRGRSAIGITADNPSCDPFPKDEYRWRMLVKRLRG